MLDIKRINAESAKTHLDKGSALFLDIRDELSFESGHIRTAQHIDNQTLPEFLTTTGKDQALIICCYHGNSSQSAAQFFIAQGFAEAYSLDGGYELWQRQFPDDCTTGLEQ